MPVPKKRTSHSKRNMRRSHHFLSPTYAVICPKCGAPVLRHRVCMACGHYRGKELVQVESESQS